MSSIEFNQLFWALMLASLMLLGSSIAVVVVDPKLVLSDVTPSVSPFWKPAKPKAKPPQAGIEDWSKSNEPMSERRKETLKAMVRELKR